MKFDLLKGRGRSIIPPAFDRFSSIAGGFMAHFLRSGVLIAMLLFPVTGIAASGDASQTDKVIKIAKNQATPAHASDTQGSHDTKSTPFPFSVVVLLLLVAITGFTPMYHRLNVGEGDEEDALSGHGANS